MDPTAQLGGAAGTLALLGERALELVAAYARELDLSEPAVPWHSTRAPVNELAHALVGVAGTCGKVALDLVLLAQTEVAEIRLPAGGSSTMPHKRNPVAPILARACARRVEALATTFTSEHEHERAAGAWHAEWESLSDMLALAGGAAGHVRAALEGLEVDRERMRANLIPETVAEAGRPVAPGARSSAPRARSSTGRALARFRSEIGEVPVG